MSVVLGHPTRITEGQLQDLFLLYCNEREVKVVAGSTDNLYSQRLSTRGHIDTIAVEGFVSMITSMPGVVVSSSSKKSPRIDHVKWAFTSKLPPCPLTNKNAKRTFELTWPLFLGALAEVSVLKYRDLDIEHANAFELFLDEHVGPLFEHRFKEIAGADGEAAAAAGEAAAESGSVRGGGGGAASTCFGDESVLSRSQRSGSAAVRARASRCVLTGEGIITLAEARQNRLRYTTFNVHNFEPITGAGANTRLAISLSLPLSYVGTAGGGAQLYGVHGKGDGLFQRSTPRDESQGRAFSSPSGGGGASSSASASGDVGGYESGGVGYFAGADAVGKGSKASAGVVRGDRYPLAMLRRDDSADAGTWANAAVDVARSEEAARTGRAPPATSYTMPRHGPTTDSEYRHMIQQLRERMSIGGGGSDRDGGGGGGGGGSGGGESSLREEGGGFGFPNESPGDSTRAFRY